MEAKRPKIRTRFSYNANDQLIRVTHSHNRTILAQFRHRLRRDGLIDRIRGDRVGIFEYDSCKRLVKEGDINLISDYDLVGNRLWRAVSQPNMSDFNTYNLADQLITSPRTNTEFTYDNNGSLIRRYNKRTRKEILYTYDGVDRLVQVKDGKNTFEYLYNGDGLLLERRHITSRRTIVQRFRYAGRQIISRVDSKGKVLELYTRDINGILLRCRRAKVIPRTRNSHSLYYLYDGLGDVIALTDVSARIRTQVKLDAWGNSTLLDPDRLGNSFRYRGAYYDPGTGLFHFGIRWYAPDLGRWMSEDPLLPTIAPKATALITPSYDELSNLYQYVGNNPVNETDPSGLGRIMTTIRVIRKVGGYSKKFLTRGGKTIGPTGAASTVERGDAVRVFGASERSRRLAAKEVAESASPIGKAVEHPPGPSGPQRPHFHPLDASGKKMPGHVLYSMTGYLTAEHYFGDNLSSNVIDFFNPLSLPRDVMDVYYEFVGDSPQQNDTSDMQ